MKAMEKKKDFYFLEYFDYRLYLLSRMICKRETKNNVVNDFKRYCEKLALLQKKFYLLQYF